MEIIKEPNELLHRPSVEVALPLSKEDQDLLNEMFSYIKEHAEEAVGLSAVQVGALKRMCAIRIKDVNKTVSYKLVNPKIVRRSADYQICEEGCLSTDGQVKVKRSSSILVSAYDVIQKKFIIINASNFLARCLQHEIDHMDGILITDRMEK